MESAAPDGDGTAGDAVYWTLSRTEGTLGLADSKRGFRGRERLLIKPTLLMTLAIPLCGAMPADGADFDPLADLPLEQLLDMSVAGSSRFAQRRSEAPAAISVIGREEIEALGYRTLSEALQTVRGATVTTDRSYDYLGIRGFLDPSDYNTRVLLLVDGNRVNDALYDQGFIGNEFPLDMELVERIEFIPGPGSAVYGANALFGVINVITREPPRQRLVTATAGWGEHGEWRTAGSLRSPIGDGGLSLHVSRLFRDGENVFDPRHADDPATLGWARGTDFERRNSLFLRWDHGSVSANLMHADRIKGSPVPVFLEFNDPTNSNRDRHTSLNVEWVGRLGGGVATMSRLFAGSYEYIGDYAIDYPPVSHNRDEDKAFWFGGEWRATGMEWGRHQLSAGLELQRTAELVQSNFDIAPEPFSYLDDHRTDWRGALYGEDRISLGATTAHLGGRLDRTVTGGAAFSPRIALTRGLGHQVDVKLLYARAFRSPNAFQLYYAVPGLSGYELNPELDSEEVDGSEAVVEWRPDSRWRVSGSVFYGRTRDLIRLASIADNTMFRFENTGRLMSRGSEMEVEFGGDGFRLRANYTFAHTTAQPEFADLARFPEHMVKATATVRIASAWNLGANVESASDRGAAPGYATADLSLGWKPGHGIALRFGVRNLFDRDIFDPGNTPEVQPVIPRPGRQIRLEVLWQGVP